MFKKWIVYNDDYRMTARDKRTRILHQRRPWRVVPVNAKGKQIGKSRNFKSLDAALGYVIDNGERHR